MVLLYTPASDRTTITKQVTNIKRENKSCKCPIPFSLTDYFYVDKWAFEIVLHTLLDSNFAKAIQGG